MSFPKRAGIAIAPERGSEPSPPLASADLGGREGTGWMRHLSEHFERMRRHHPDEDLCIVFDIDGTILDIRHLVVHVLLAYDRSRGTTLFRGLVADDITHHEDDIDRVLGSLAVPADVRLEVAAYYRAHLWDQEAIWAASRPYEGVFGVIRWFQLQPRTLVALNTGRAHHMRKDTLDSLNTIGAAYRVRFDPQLLFTADEGGDIPSHKVAAIRDPRARAHRCASGGRRGQRAGEPPSHGRDRPEGRDPLPARRHDLPVAATPSGPVDRRTLLPTRELVPERAFSGRVEFVWHGVNDELNLSRFLDSDVRWAEIDVRRDPVGDLVLRHDGFEETPWRRDESTMLAADTIHQLEAAGRSVKLDLKEGGSTLAESVELVDATGMGDDRVWFNAELPTLGEMGFESIRERFPRSRISAPVDFLLPLVRASETATQHTLRLLRTWGISRLSLRWSPLVRSSLDEFETLGWEVNVYGVPDLEAFLEASLLLPTSITADFNFPEWRYFGRGSGAGGARHRYDD